MKWLIIFCICFAACKNKHDIEFKKVDPGLQYKLFNNGGGDTVQPGQYLKLHVKQYYNDSLLSDTDSTLPQYQQLDTTQLSKESYNIFSKVRVGDSLVFKVPVDSAFKNNRPAFAKKNGWLITYVKVDAIFRSDIEAQADLEMKKAKRKPK
jgi:hypothetical protein